MWDLPGPGLELVAPALAGGFLTTVAPGKSLLYSLYSDWFFPFVIELYILRILDITPYQIYDLQIFSPIIRLPFHFVDGFLCRTEAF